MIQDLLFTVLGWIITGASTISGIAYALKVGKNPAQYIFSKILGGKDKMTKLALGAQVARIGVLFSEYVSLDLVDGTADGLQILEQWLKDQMIKYKNVSNSVKQMAGAVDGNSGNLL